jgi:UDP-glucose 4-epimerase
LTFLLLGGGLVGSGFRSVLERRGLDVHRITPRWGSPDQLAGDVEAAVTALLPDDGRATVVWAAGVGHVGATPTQMLAENVGLSALCGAVSALQPARREQVRVLFASSAGALFAGCGAREVDEDTEPQPASAYGEQKLAQEEALRATAERTGCRVVVCRISNGYGLAGGRLAARGLVSSAVRATRLRQPLTVYVSQDTRRDYIYNEDIAEQALRLLQAAPPGLSRALVRDGTGRTVSEVLSLVGRVSGRRVPATYAERPETRLQPRVLRFAPPLRSDDAARRTPMETAVHLMLRAPMAPDTQPLSTSPNGSNGSNGSRGSGSRGTG